MYRFHTHALCEEEEYKTKHAAAMEGMKIDRRTAESRLAETRDVGGALSSAD